MQLYTRKQFLRLGAAAGAGALLSSRNSTFLGQGQNALPPGTHAAQAPSASQPSFEIVRQEDPRWAELRKVYNKRILKTPQVIAPCSSTKDVAAAIAHAREHRLAVAIRSGGHSMEGFSSNDGGMVIHLGNMNSVELRGDQTVKVGPGCTLAHLYDELLPKRRLVPAGSCGTVGIGGLTTGGGYGLFSRKYGLTCDHLLEATVVDGQGVVRATRDDPELLWAIRGGGAGNFAVVTEMIFRTHLSPPTMQAHHFKSRGLDARRAAKILEAWFSFAQQLPISCFSAYVLNGSTLNVLVTNFEYHSDALERLLTEFAAFTDQRRTGKPGDLAASLRHYYGSLVPLYFKNASAGFYQDFSNIRDCIVEVLERCLQAPGMIYQVNTMGGNISNPDFEAVSCYPHRGYKFLSELQAYWQNPAKEGQMTAAFREIQDLFWKNGVRAQYINYCSLDFKNWEQAYYGNNYSRLQAVKKKYDPGNVIHHPQSVH
jgi:FAD/FMN-containing dehydrogenase